MRYFVFTLMFLISSCAGLPQPDGFTFVEIQAPPFVLASWVRVQKPVDTLKIYIEGDGFAWRTPYEPSFDPTPRRSLVLEWAEKSTGNVIYLARPCQYVWSNHCSMRYWTMERFAPEVIKAMDTAVSQMIDRYQPRKIELVGYSGGATVAVIIAANHRDIVAKLTTVAGVLNHLEWTKYHGDTPLTGSMNAIEYLRRIDDIPQIHYVGGQDDVVPPELTRKAILNPALIVEIPQASHCENWPESF